MSNPADGGMSDWPAQRLRDPQGLRTHLGSGPTLGSASKREAPCRHCGSDWHYSDEHVFPTGGGGPCARYFGSDGTLCSTHHGRFASPSATRCADRGALR